MSRNHQETIHSTNYDFAGFAQIGLRFFIAKSISHELSAELKAKRVEIWKKMLDLLR
jgi:hypothetical protein